MEVKTKEKPAHKRTEIRRAFQKIRPKIDSVLGSEYDSFKQMALISRHSPVFLSMILEESESMNMKIFRVQSTVLPDSLPYPIRQKLALTETIRRLMELKKECQNGFSERISIILSGLKAIAKREKNEGQILPQSENENPPSGGWAGGFPP